MIPIEPNADLAFYILRLALAVVFLAHGPEKITRNTESAKGMGLSPVTTYLVGAAEVLGALSMILGVWLRVSAVFFIIVMLGAIYFKTQKWEKGFTGPGGFELDFLLIATALAVLLGAPATYALF